MVDRLVEEGMKADLCIGGKRYGLVLDVGGYYKNVITLAPSLDISYEEMDLAVELLDQLFGRVTSRSRARAGTRQPVPEPL
jgi:4-aminobutyrate aminotransferase-like enzyme